MDMVDYLVGNAAIVLKDVVILGASGFDELLNHRLLERLVVSVVRKSGQYTLVSR